MNPLKYFAYGSNLHPRRFTLRVPSAQVLGSAWLEGWQLRFHKRGSDGSAKCSVVWSQVQEDRVHGAVYAMASADKPGLDEAEGLGVGYEERWVELPSHGRVFLYVANPHHVAEGLLPYTWYKEYVLRGARHHAFPPPYIQKIKRVPAIPDPDAARDRGHWDILNAHAYGNL